MPQRNNAVARRSQRFVPTAFVAAQAAKFARKGSRVLAKTFKDRKKSKGKGKSAVGALPKDRIGRHSGLIVSHQKVPRPKAGSVQYRKSVFGSVEQADKMWIGGSSLGTEAVHFKTIAHAILAYYLPKMNDMRASNVQVPNAVPLFANFTVKYLKDAPNSSMIGATNGVQLPISGAIITNADYVTMAVQLGEQIAEFAHAGMFPASIEFLEPLSLHAFLRDSELGRHTITVAIKGTFRFQNVTPAGNGTDPSSHNINAIDANPVNGKIFTFRNQAPLFASNYSQTLSSADQQGILDLQSVAKPFEMYALSANQTANPTKGGAAFTHIKAPPLNPKSIWKNVSSTGTAVFPPGGFKTYKTSYLRSDTIAKYCQAITQSDKNLDATGTFEFDSSQARYPPAGDSFMMCLRPTIKTLQADETGEVIKMCYNTEHILQAMIKKRKPSPLQVVNLIE